MSAGSAGVGRAPRRALERFSSDRAAGAALGYLALLALAGFAAPFAISWDPNAVDLANRFAPASAAHWLGTDDLGRDLLARLCVGARVSLRTSFQVVTTALAAALPIGLASGYFGGRTDALLMRLMDAVLSFPPLILAMAVAGVLGPGLVNLMIAISVLFVPGFARLIRAQTLAVREETFIEASVAAGSSAVWILAHRVLPNVASPLIVQASLGLGTALLAEAGLSFLGLGLEPPAASWGSMLRRAHEFIFTEPSAMFVPGLAIASTVLAFNTVGDGLRDALGIAASGHRLRAGRLGLTATAVGRQAPSAESPSPGTPDAGSGSGAPLLEVESLRVEIGSGSRTAVVVDDLDLRIDRGEIVALVGESGAGKSMTALSLLRLAPDAARITRGAVRFEGRDLLGLPFEEMRRVRGGEIAMIFQDPMASLNPAYRIGDQIREAVMLHEALPRAAAGRLAVEMLDRVGIPDPERRAQEHPHQFSGGMRQRAMLAMALACRPKLLIADEPTTALDVTIQAQILDLLRSLQEELGMAVLFVTHDLGVVADLCERVVVMYAGQKVEEAAAEPLFATPRHPYSAGLLAAMPRMAARDGVLYSIPGQVPAAGEVLPGCRFEPRCPHAEAVCRSSAVALEAVGPRAETRCARHDALALEGTR